MTIKYYFVKYFSSKNYDFIIVFHMIKLIIMFMHYKIKSLNAFIIIITNRVVKNKSNEQINLYFRSCLIQ